MRRNYLKIIGEEPSKQSRPRTFDRSDQRETGNEEQKQAINKDSTEPEKKLTGRQLARQKRSEEHHKRVDRENELKEKIRQRKMHKKVMTTKTSRGQPKLGSQIGMLLDKIRKQNDS